MDAPVPDQPEEQPDPNTPQSHEVRHSHVSAVVPEEIAAGVYSTGTMILQGQHEFIIDFLLRLGKPHQLVSRVVLPQTVIPSMINALQSNLKAYETKMGQGQPLASGEVSPAQETPATKPENQPTGPNGPGASHQVVSHDQPAHATPPSHIEELYNELKITSEVMSGTYANAVLIGHSQHEISFDFITTFYPRSTVAARIHTAIPNAQRLLDSLIQAYEQFQQRQPKPPAPEEKPPEE